MMIVRNPRCFVLSSFVAVLLFHVSTCYSQEPTTATLDLTYLNTSCATTQFPSVCYQSLRRYACNVSQDPGRLATAAMAVTLSRAMRLSAYLYNVSRESHVANSVAPSALSYCISNVDDAVDEIESSLKQMRDVASSSALDEIKYQISNVQTWMSAALTDQETCTDGFEGVDDWPMKEPVFDRVGKVKKFTSNALALVNNFARTKTGY